MEYPISITTIDSSVKFHEEVLPLLSEAQNYLEGHPWCKKILNGWSFTNVGYAVCIFLFEIDNTQSKDDNLIWLIVGDFPPMYMDTFNVKTTKEVVEVYIELASEWIEKAERGDVLDDCYPLEVDLNNNSINLLKSKVTGLRDIIVNNIDEIDFNVPLERK